MKHFFPFFLAALFLVGCGRETAVNELSPIVGQFVFIEVDGADQHVSLYDLESEEVTQLFTADPNGFVSNIAVSPNGQKLIMAYAEPPPEGEVQFGYTSLFLTELLDTAVLTPLTQISIEGESFFNPVWSPDGTAVMYTHVLPDAANPTQFDIFLESLQLETGETVRLAEDVIWPRYAPSGEKIAYVTVNPDTLGNALWVADPDGTNATQIVAEDAFMVVDVPLFSEDEETLYFTANSSEQSSRSWWELLLGIKTAAAHNIPSDWYKITLPTSEPERITNIAEVGIYGDFAPNHGAIGFATFNGLYTLDPRSGTVTQRLEINATSSFAWIALEK